MGVVALCAALLLTGGCGGSQSQATSSTSTLTEGPPARKQAARAKSRSPRPPRAHRTQAHAPFAVGVRTVTFVDHSRRVDVAGVSEPRTLVTVIRYPLHAAGERFPLIVFGHGFTETPAPYGALLAAWARAGYVVAAPVFPLENANAPGGPNESDLIHQPRDMSFLISRMLAASAAHGFLSGLIDPGAIAVTGQSDGGETALAVAYDRYFLDPRVRAAVILSGAEIPGVGGFTFPSPSPPLLATQGTADTINPPSLTDTFYDTAPRPKFLLNLLGASHLPPYTDQQPQLGIVERVTTAFLDRYLKGRPHALAQMAAAGNVPGLAELVAEP